MIWGEVGTHSLMLKNPHIGLPVPPSPSPFLLIFPPSQDVALLLSSPPFTFSAGILLSQFLFLVCMHFGVQGLVAACSGVLWWGGCHASLHRPCQSASSTSYLCVRGLCLQWPRRCQLYLDAMSTSCGFAPLFTFIPAR